MHFITIIILLIHVTGVESSFVKPCTGDIKRSNGKRREHPSPTDTPADDAPVVYEEVTTDSHSEQKLTRGARILLMAQLFRKG
jgi:hypothetical protein